MSHHTGLGFSWERVWLEHTPAARCDSSPFFIHVALNTSRMKACRIAVEHRTGRDESLLWFGVFQLPYFISVFPSILTKRKMGTNNPDPTGDKNADNHFLSKVGEGHRCALRELDLSLGWSQVTCVWLKHPHTLCVWLVYMGILFTVLRCCLDNWDVFLRLLKSPITYI